uniref:Uncharacterized protein n=1 Tax=Chenopodium quinoa TaxID=63459 RepID=A0A803N792_CHEQI
MRLYMNIGNDLGDFVDVASGGALIDKTPEQAKKLISNIAQNSQRYGTRYDVVSKRVNDVGVHNLEASLAENSRQISQLSNLASGTQVAMVCGICNDCTHHTDACPTLQVDEVNVVGGFPRAPQRKYDPFSNTYNEGWRDHPNLRFGNKENPPGF